MKKFINQTCPVCKEAFQEFDDIVVCPDCGTPHHRDCFAKSGHCVNEQKHGTDWSYQTEPNAGKSQQGTAQPSLDDQLRCPQCGAVNDTGALFCSNCGNSLASHPQTAESQNPQSIFPNTVSQIPPILYSSLGGVSNDEELDGIKASDYADYVGTNQGYFLPKFKCFANKKILSVNFCAFLFPSIYYLYRKVYSFGIFFFLLDLSVLLGNVAFYLASGISADYAVAYDLVYGISTALSVLQLVCGVLSGIFGNWLYYRKARKEICKRQKQGIISAEDRERLKKRGSVSYAVASTGVLLLTLFAMLGTYAGLLLL